MNPEELHPHPRRRKPNMNKWNQVMPMTTATKMPTIGQWVLIYDGQAMRIGQWIIVSQGVGAFVDEQREIIDRTVTHWAPLPATPSI